jgi:beta-lactamase regulating signal transducer with metallopeptidase domain
MAPLLIALAWKSTLLCVAALIGMWAMRARPAVERVVLLRVALAALLALPVLTLMLPAADVPLLPVPEAAPAEAMVTSLPHQVATITQHMPRAEPAAPAELVGPLYLAGAALLLLHLMLGIATLIRWTRRGRPIADGQWQAAMARSAERRPVRLLVSAQAATPLSWGIAPAWILIDPHTAARPEHAQSVVAHEIAHIRRFDWLALVAAHLAVALFWFNPLVWLLRRQLVREAELAADCDAVREVAQTDYAQVLLSVAARPAGLRIANGMALARGTLPHRIATLLEGRAHRRASRVLTVAMLIGGLGVTAPLAAMKLVPAAVPAGTEIKLRTVSAAPAPWSAPVPGPQKAASAADATLRWAEVSRAKPRVQAPASAPLPSPPPEPHFTLPQPRPMILSAPGKQAAALPAPQQAIDPAEQARRSIEEGLRSAEEGKRQAIESRAETAANLMESAAEMREQAMDLEESANEDNLPLPVREGHRKAAQSMRAQAAQMESQAKALLGTP